MGGRINVCAEFDANAHINGLDTEKLELSSWEFDKLIDFDAKIAPTQFFLPPQKIITSLFANARQGGKET